MERMNRKKKGLQLIGSWLGALLMIGGCLFFWGMEETKHDHSVVFLSPNENRTLVFYKDDCSDCSRVFPEIYMHQLLYKDLVFINLNQKKNRSYISTYGLTQVPTVIRKGQRIVGPNQKQIELFLKASKGE